MSSSNAVKLSYVEELTYNQKPADPVTLREIRHTSEGLTGTPQLTDSEEVRPDRNSLGRVVTGLDITGPINFELCSDPWMYDWIRAAMMQAAWVPAELVSTTVTLTPDGLDPQKAVLTLADEFANLIPGVMCIFTPAGASLPVVVQITTVDTPSTVFTVATRRGEQAVSAEALSVSIPAYVDIGRTQVSFTVGKAYEDVTHGVGADMHSQTYTGEMVSGFTVDATYGQIITGNFDTMGAGYEQPTRAYEQVVVDNGGTIAPAGTNPPISSSIDIPLVTVADVATDFCVQQFTLTLDNGLTPQNCIGVQAPTGYNLGTATVSVSAEIYLSDTSYDAFMAQKLNQTPVSMSYVAQTESGGFIFHVEALQLSFADPANPGQNQDVMISAEGVGKIGENGESSLRIYRL